MLKEIKNINPNQLTDVEQLRSAMTVLINAVERLLQENEVLRQKNQALQDENNKLKGGNARPKIKPSIKPSGDISSQGKEKGYKNHKQIEAKQPISIDREIVVKIEKTDLPFDAVFKGHAAFIQQDIVLLRDNKRFLFETWYSPSEHRTLTAAWPQDMIEGHYGAGVRSLMNVLHHFGNVTEGCLESLLGSFGIQISGGTVSNLLKAEQTWVVEEQSDILQAALQREEPKQMDATSNRQKGVNKVTHIITASFFSVFYTLSSKSRLDCLRALQGNPTKGISLLWHDEIDTDFQQAGVGATDRAVIRRLMQANPCLTLVEFDALLKDQAPKIFAKASVIRALRDVMALAYYATQPHFLRLNVLLSDDAPEYNKIGLFHALCWVHDARYYNKLTPKIALNEQKLQDFKARYWDFYQELLDFKELKPKKQKRLKDHLTLKFDQIFIANTQYGALDLVIERTKANKQQLLRVLDFPDLPLHNNAAELAARKVVRKRDISLHTWSDWGTQIRDAFMSVIETARKLNISAYDFIYDRIHQHYKMPSMASVIYPAFTRTF